MNASLDTNWVNETLSYMIFMANYWNKTVCLKIYGDALGNHIWDKYIRYVNDNGNYGAMSRIVFELDKENLKKLIDFACSIYNGRQMR